MPRGPSLRYLQLAHNEWDAAKGRSVPRAIYGYGREDQLDKDAVRRLVASMSRLLEPGDVPAAPGEGLEFAETRPYGAAYVLDLRLHSRSEPWWNGSISDSMGFVGGYRCILSSGRPDCRPAGKIRSLCRVVRGTAHRRDRVRADRRN